MKITDVRTVLLTGPCTNDPYLDAIRKERSAAFIIIETDTEYRGVGETYAGYFFPEAVPEIVNFFKPILVNQDPSEIETLWQRMYHSGNFWCRVGLGAIVLTGIEAALWDLKGKEENKPVYKLLQEKWHSKFKLPFNYSAVDRLPCYATGGPSLFPLNKLEEKISFYQSLGFNGVKIGAGHYEIGKGFFISNDPNQAADQEARKLEFVRRQFGNYAWIMMDAHMGNSFGATWQYDTALAVAKAVEPYDLFFLEEPLHYTQPEAYARLCSNTTTKIAGGECLTSVSEWQIFIEKDSFHIGQPDASFTSGINAFMEVAVGLSQKLRNIATHAWGAGASLMQNIHAGFACPNTCMLEVAPAYGPLHSELIVDTPRLKDGYMLPPEMPGWGIELREETIQKFPFIPGSGEFNSVPGKILKLG